MGGGAPFHHLPPGVNWMCAPRVMVVLPMFSASHSCACVNGREVFVWVGGRARVGGGRVRGWGRGARSSTRQRPPQPPMRVPHPYLILCVDPLLGVGRRGGRGRQRPWRLGRRGRRRGELGVRRPPSEGRVGLGGALWVDLGGRGVGVEVDGGLRVGGGGRGSMGGSGQTNKTNKPSKGGRQQGREQGRGGGAARAPSPTTPCRCRLQTRRRCSLQTSSR